MRCSEALGAACGGLARERARPEHHENQRSPRRSTSVAILGGSFQQPARRWIAVDDTDEGWPPAVRSNLVISHPTLGISASDVLHALRSALRRFSY